MTTPTIENTELQDKARKWLADNHAAIMGNYDGDPWTEHPYQDSSKPYFWDDSSKALAQFISQEILSTLERLEKKSIEGNFNETYLQAVTTGWIKQEKSKWNG
jgi:hypothetical protein